MSTVCKVMTGAFVAALCVPVPQAQALLVDRGSGMLYDTVLNVTWLQDANHAKTSGYDSDGRMTWTQANTWANSLVYGGYGDWRTARNSPVNGTASGWSYSNSPDGSTDVGYNIISTFSELSYMYYVNLGLKGYYSASGAYQPDFGVNGNGTYGGQKDVGLVRNLQSDVYWSSTAYAPSPAVSAWGFNAYHGVQGYGLQSDEFFAWAVRDGDVTVVPVPGSVALLAGGLALLRVVTRRRGRLGASEA
jgi:hypothetical protein